MVLRQGMGTHSRTPDLGSGPGNGSSTGGDGEGRQKVKGGLIVVGEGCSRQGEHLGPKACSEISLDLSK